MNVRFSTPTQVMSTPKANGIAPKRQNRKAGKSINFKSAASISRELAEKGIRTEFQNNDFYAQCAKQTVELFEKRFGPSSLPTLIEYTALSDGIYGDYSPFSREIRFNSSIKEMSSMKGLEKLAKSWHHYILPNDFAAIHPANTHVHEFAHSAHHANLNKRHGGAGSDIMYKLRHTQVPTAIGRLITRYKLGNYSLNSEGGMNEFMAERISKDVCNDISMTYWQPYYTADLEYSNIFSRKWNYRYSSPQSYLDYFTQQVWNGDIESAERVGRAAAEYLREIDCVKVPETVSTITEKVPEGSLISKFMNGVSGLFENITNGLDKRNDLMIEY